MPVLTDPKWRDPHEVILGDAYPAEETGFTLTRRQERLYQYRADLYAPLLLDLAEDQAASDIAYPTRPTAASVPCWKRESQEQNQASPVGRTNYDISLTIDEFTFPSGVDIEDGWLIKLYPLTPESLIGSVAEGAVQVADNEIQFYVVQGGPQDRPSVGRRQSNQRKVFAVKTSPPVTNAGQLLMRKT